MSMRVGKLRLVAYASMGFALTFVSGAETGARAQATPKSQEQQLPPLIRSVEGPDLFRLYCASCHGVHGKGDGPVAQFLKVGPPDLTLLTEGNRGEFPSGRVRQMILGDEVEAVHGTREMPIWGPVFHQIESDVDRGNVRVENLLNYLESMQSIQLAQRVPVAKDSVEGNSSSGEQLYKRLCAAMGMT